MLSSLAREDLRDALFRPAKLLRAISYHFTLRVALANLLVPFRLFGHPVVLYPPRKGCVVEHLDNVEDGQPNIDALSRRGLYSMSARACWPLFFMMSDAVSTFSNCQPFAPARLNDSIGI